jgi:hypothetical protein
MLLPKLRSRSGRGVGDENELAVALLFLQGREEERGGRDDDQEERRQGRDG